MMATNITEEKEEGHLGWGTLIQMLSTRNALSFTCGVFCKYMVRYFPGSSSVNKEWCVSCTLKCIAWGGSHKRWLMSLWSKVLFNLPLLSCDGPRALRIPELEKVGLRHLILYQSALPGLAGRAAPADSGTPFRHHNREYNENPALR